MPRFDDDYDDEDRPSRRPSRRRGSDDSDHDDRDEERPSSRRRYRDEEDDERPRRRYRDEEEEDFDDRPRRRARRRFDSDDDEDERQPAKKKHIGVLAGVMGGIAGFLAVSNMRDNRPAPAPPPPIVAPWGNIPKPGDPVGPAGPADFAKDPITITNLRLEPNAEAGKSPDLVFDYDSSEPLDTPLCVVAIIPGVVGQNVVNIEPLTQKRDKIRLSTTDFKVVDFKAGITVFVARRPGNGFVFPQPISNMMMLHLNAMGK